MCKLRRSNGVVTEKAHLNTDTKKYEENWERIFGKNKKEVKKEEDVGLRKEEEKTKE